MATRIERVRRAAAATPWAIMPEKLEEIAALLEIRSEGQLSAEEIRARIGDPERRQSMKAGGVAVLPLYGVVSQRMDMMTEMSGGTSTEKFGARFDQAMNDPDIGAIVIDVDSPGGSVPGVEELAAKIHAARGKGKRVIALANSLAASAAYWIASAADEFVVTPSGMVGSIGVYTIHEDYSEALEKAGIKTTVIRAGKFKAEGNPYEPMSDEALAAAQEQVAEIYDRFVGNVAKHRGVTVAKVEAGFGQGRVMSAQKALAAGMVDRIATMEDVLTELGVSRGRYASARAEDVAQEIGAMHVTDGTVAREITAGTGSLRWAGVDAEARVYPVEADMETDASVARAALGEMENAPTTKPAPEARETAMSIQDTAAHNGAATEGTQTAGSGVTQTHTNAPSVSVGTDFSAERQRARAISELCAMHGLSAEAGDHIASGASVVDVVEKIRGRAESNLRAMSAPAVDMSPKEQKRYSISRAIMGASQRILGERVTFDDGFEQEVSHEIASNLPQDYKSRGGIFVPTRFRAALDSGTSTAGQELKFTEAGDFIDLLRARMQVAQLGATILTGLQGPVAFPKQNGAGTFSWVAEDPGSDLADSDLTLTQVALNPKTGQSTTAYSRQLLAQAVIDVDNLVQRDLATITALGIDLAAINGSGASNQPTGVLNTSGIGSVAVGTNGGVPTYDHVVDLETEVATDNADIGTMAYLTTPGIRGKLKKTQQFASSNGVPVWTGGMEGELNGYRAAVSTQVPSTLTKGNSSGNCHAIIFGVWSQLILGYWGAYELVIDPYTKKKQGLIELTSFQMMGVAVRHAESFAACKDAKTS